MSHFFVVASNENGIITDDYLASDLDKALNSPFEFSDVFIYSHGWWNTPNRATQDYNRFTIEFAETVRALAAAAPPPALGALPKASLGIGVYWPSMLSADTDSFVNRIQFTSFYTMEKRADAIGEHAGYFLLKKIAAAASNGKLKRVHLIGHSFGCKVICNALQWLTRDPDDKTDLAALNSLSLNVVLIEAGMDEDHLEKGDAYGDIAAKYPNIRFLATTSQEDTGLTRLYPAAQAAKIVTLFSNRRALGAVGPTVKAAKPFGGRKDITVAPGISRSSVAKLNDRFIVADITQLHQDPALTVTPDPMTGHHSTIFLPDLYNVLAGFLFQV